MWVHVNQIGEGPGQIHRFGHISRRWGVGGGKSSAAAWLADYTSCLFILNVLSGLMLSPRSGPPTNTNGTTKPLRTTVHINFCQIYSQSLNVFQGRNQDAGQQTKLVINNFWQLIIYFHTVTNYASMNIPCVPSEVLFQISIHHLLRVKHLHHMVSRLVI